MKWFKHETDSKDSEKMKALRDEFGFAGIGRFWALMEIVACKMDESTRCHYEQRESEWLTFFKLKKNKLRTFLERIENVFNIKVVHSLNIIRIEVPNLLEKRDNYAKYYKQNLPALQTNLPLEVEEEEEEEVKTSSARKLFLNLWNTLPPEMKKGKDRSWNYFKTQVGTEKDLKDIQQALKNYLDQIIFIRSNGHPDRQYQHGSTWFNGNWKDYINISVSSTSPVKKIRSTMEQAFDGQGEFVDFILARWAILDAKHPDWTPKLISEAIIQAIKGEDMSAALRVIRDFKSE